jgi:hypothetical protein
MRTILVLFCSLALALAASGAQEKKKEEKSPPKKQPQAAQAAKPRGTAAKAGGPQRQANASQNPPGAQKGVFESEKGKGKRAQQPTNAGAGQPAGGQQKTKEKKGAQGASPAVGQAGGERGPGKAKQGQANAAQAKSKPVKPQHFNVPSKPNTAKAPPVKFQQNRRIEGSQNWQGAKYAAFRNYKSEWHDKNWWHSHHNRIVFVFDAPYFWNAGYWYPAWGYAPDAYYAWDGPIYASNNLPPDQVIANVQASLQQQGYYQGEVDGLLGPQTRGALAAYQRDHGLYETSAIDQPTLQSLGMA